MPTDYLLIVKPGDQASALNKPYMTLKEGSVVEIIDRTDPTWKGASFNEIITDHMKKVYAMGYINKSQIPMIKETLPEIGYFKLVYPNIPDTNVYRKRTKLIPLNVLAGISGDANLEKNWRSTSIIPIQDWTGLRETDFIDASSKPNTPEIYDLNSISSGSYTVGSGGDYATWAAAWGDLAGLTGILYLTEIASTTNNVTTNIDIDLNNYSLIMTSRGRHWGNFNAAYRISTSIDNDTVRLRAEGPGTIIMSKFDIYQSANAGDQFIVISTIDAACDIYIYDILFDANNLAKEAIYLNDDTPNVYCYNIVGRNFVNGRVLAVEVGTSSDIFENITGYNSAAGIYRISSEPIIMRNCAGHTSPDDYNSIDSATGYNNASEDGSAADGNWSTGSGNITAATSQYYDNYKINSSSSLFGAGSNPTITGHTHYINGVPIIPGAVDIGAWGVPRGHDMALGHNF